MASQIKKIVFDTSFEKDFGKYKENLSDKGIGKLKEKLVAFRENPFNPRLKMYKLRGNLKDYWSFSIIYSNRILFRFLNDKTVFFLLILATIKFINRSLVILCVYT